MAYRDAAGLMNFVRDIADERLMIEKDEYAKYTLGMLVDILGRIQHSVDSRIMKGPAQLMMGTVKVFCSVTAVLVMEMAKEGHEDQAKKVALDQFTEQLNEAIEMYKGVLEKMRQKKEKDFI